jgi:chromosome segregation ATPase
MPEYQQCTITFPDGFDYTYKVPIVKIQSYSLEDIADKKLLVFLPFTLMRFAPRVTKNKDALSEKELTDFIQQIIVMLDNEVNEGRLTVTQYKDYTKLLQYAAERVFRHTPKHQEEVYGMIKSRLVLPSDEIEMMEKTLAEKVAALAEKDSALAEKDSALAEKDSALAEKDSALAEKDSALAEKNQQLNEQSSLIQQLLEENQRLRQLQKQ